MNYIYIYGTIPWVSPLQLLPNDPFFSAPVFQAWPRNETELVEAAHATARGSSSVEVQVFR